MNDLDKIKCIVGIGLKELRLKSGYKSYEQFAFEHKMSRIQYWKMENGTNFTIKSLLNILNAHDIELETFISTLCEKANTKTKDSLRLEKIIVHTAMNKKEFAEHLGYKNLNQLNHILFGGSLISIPLAHKIKKHFPELNLAWILEGKGEFLEENH